MTSMYHQPSSWIQGHFPDVYPVKYLDHKNVIQEPTGRCTTWLFAKDGTKSGALKPGVVRGLRIRAVHSNRDVQVARAAC